MPSSASATSSSKRSGDTSTPARYRRGGRGKLRRPRFLTHCPQRDARHAHLVHNVSTGVSTSYPEMSKVVEILLTVVLRIGKVTPPDAQCTARRKASSTPKGERPARSHGSRKEIVEPGGVVQRVFGTSHAEGVVHRRVGPREWVRSEAGGVRSAGAPKGAREAARRGTGNGPEKYGRLRPEGYSGPNRVFPRQPVGHSAFPQALGTNARLIGHGLPRRRSPSAPPPF